MRKIIFISKALALAEPVPLTLPTLMVKSLTRTLLILAFLFFGYRLGHLHDGFE